MEDTEICIVQANEMKKPVERTQRLKSVFMKLMGSKVLEMEHRLESLVLKTVAAVSLNTW